MPGDGRVSVLFKRTAVSTAKTVIQVKAGQNIGFEIVRLWCGQHTNAILAQAVLSIVWKTAAATVTAGIRAVDDTATVIEHNREAGAPVSNLELGTAATGINASAEGTDGAELWSEPFNVVAGLLYFPDKNLDGERIWIPPGGIIGVTFKVAPPNRDYTIGITVRETNS